MRTSPLTITLPLPAKGLDVPVQESQVQRRTLALGPAPRLQEGVKRPPAIDSSLVPFITTIAEKRVDHNLGRVPTRFVVVWKSAAVDLFPGPTAWNASSCFFAATVASVQVTVEIA